HCECERIDVPALIERLSFWLRRISIECCVRFESQTNRNCPRCSSRERGVGLERLTWLTCSFSIGDLRNRKRNLSHPQRERQRVEVLALVERLNKRMRCVESSIGLESQTDGDRLLRCSRECRIGLESLTNS